MLAPAEAVRLEIAGRAARGNAAQTMLIWPGIVLIGCVAASRCGIQNGVLYKVVDVNDEKVWLQGDVILTHDQAKKWLRLSYAQTYASCQESEFDGPLMLHDCSHKFFSRKHLFVGLSRAKLAAEVGLT